MAEEQRWQQEGHHRLCANNCGFFGSPATLNLCSKCYCDRQGQEAPAAPPAAAAAASSFLPSSSSSSSSASASAAAAGASEKGVAAEPVSAASESSSPPAQAGARAASRCACCRKRVGLTGFTCRCGGTFCGTHRYPERHACGFDFKAAGRVAIARANPVVKGDKLKDKA